MLIRLLGFEFASQVLELANSNMVSTVGKVPTAQEMFLAVFISDPDGAVGRGAMTVVNARFCANYVCRRSWKGTVAAMLRSTVTRKIR